MADDQQSSNSGHSESPQGCVFRRQLSTNAAPNGRQAAQHSQHPAPKEPTHQPHTHGLPSASRRERRRPRQGLSRGIWRAPIASDAFTAPPSFIIARNPSSCPHAPVSTVKNRLDKTSMRRDKSLSIGSGPGSHPLKPLALVIRGVPSFDTTVAAYSPPCEYSMIALSVAEIRHTSI